MTRIDEAVLGNENRDAVADLLSACTIAKRMSWAAFRETERPEDRAYSLMGIFDVNMPLFYGEGRKAFLRLQEEILKISNDLSILGWGYIEPKPPISNLLATDPNQFAHCSGIRFSPTEPQGNIVLALTNLGIRVERPLVVHDIDRWGVNTFALSLECRSDRDITQVMALRLKPTHSSSTQEASRYDSLLTVCASSREAESRIISVSRLEPERLTFWSSLTIGRSSRPAE